MKADQMESGSVPLWTVVEKCERRAEEALLLTTLSEISKLGNA
jgi:hypothetical protein